MGRLPGGRFHARARRAVSAGLAARMAPRCAGFRARGGRLPRRPLPNAIPTPSPASSREVDRARHRAEVDLSTGAGGTVGVAAQRASRTWPAVLDYVSHVTKAGAGRAGVSLVATPDFHCTPM